MNNTTLPAINGLDSDDYDAIWRPSITDEEGYEEEIRQLQESSAEHQFHPLAILTWMSALSGLARSEEAISWGLRGCYEYAEDARFFLKTAELLAGQGRTEEAEALLARGPENMEEKGVFWIIKIHCHALRGEREQALQALRHYGSCRGGSEACRRRWPTGLKSR
jgi:hypothetical protein